MGTIVNAVVPTSDLALQDTFEEAPRAEFDTVRTAASDSDHPVSFLRARAPELDVMEAALRADTTIATVKRFSRGAERRLYRMEWQPQTRSLFELLTTGDGTLLGAAARDAGWEFELLFPDHCMASQTYDRCQDRGIGLTIRQVTNDTERMTDDGSTLSDEQREALVTAFQTDYYRVPRDVSQVELADQLGLSHQALSERLRRGHERLISNTLCADMR